MNIQMDIQTELTSLRKNANLPRPEYAVECCRLAKQLEKAGNYELAAEVLGEFWPDHNSAPDLTGLDDFARAHVLLRTGSLAGWLGSAHQQGGTQEDGKNLITRSIELFEKLNEPMFLAEARGDLALCY